MAMRDGHGCLCVRDHACGHVCGHVQEKAHGHVCEHVYGHEYGYGSRTVRALVHACVRELRVRARVSALCVWTDVSKYVWTAVRTGSTGMCIGRRAVAAQ